MEGKPVQRRRSISHDRVGKPVKPLPDGPSWPVGFPVGEPAKPGADDEIDVGARLHGEGGALKAALASSNDHHSPVAVAVVVLESGGESDTIAHGFRERRRRLGEGDCSDRDDDPTRLDLPSRGRAQPVAVSDSVERNDVRWVAFGNERMAKPVRVAEKLLERNRLFPLLARLLRPAVDGAQVAGCGERGFFPVRPEEHVGRHPGPPGFHRLAERSDTPSCHVRGDGESVRARTDDCDIEAFRHAGTLRAAANRREVPQG
jgi:hypothetical protein